MIAFAVQENFSQWREHVPQSGSKPPGMKTLYTVNCRDFDVWLSRTNTQIYWFCIYIHAFYTLCNFHIVPFLTQELKTHPWPQSKIVRVVHQSRRSPQQRKLVDFGESETADSWYYINFKKQWISDFTPASHTFWRIHLKEKRNTPCFWGGIASSKTPRLSPWEVESTLRQFWFSRHSCFTCENCKSPKSTKNCGASTEDSIHLDHSISLMFKPL